MTTAAKTADGILEAARVAHESVLIVEREIRVAIDALGSINPDAIGTSATIAGSIYEASRSIADELKSRDGLMSDETADLVALAELAVARSPK